MTRSAIWLQKGQHEPPKYFEDKRKAIEDAHQAIRYDPNNPAVYNNVGYLLWKNGNDAEGECDLRHAIELNPQYTPAEVNLGLLLASQQGGASTPCKYGKEIMYTSLSEALVQSGDWKEAIVMSQKALAAKEPAGEAAMANALAAARKGSNHPANSR